MTYLKRPITLRIALIALVGVISSCTQSSATPESQKFPLTLLWSFEADSAIRLPPLYTGGIVFVQANTALFQVTHYALDADSGNLLWKYQTGSNLGFRECCWGVASGNLLLAGSDRIEAVSLASGEVAWVTKGHNPISSIAVAEDTLFVSAKGHVTALDAPTGAEKWDNKSFPGYGFPVFYDARNDRLVIPDEKLYTLDAATGVLLSAIEVDVGEDCGNRLDNLRVYDDRIYCHAMAFEIETGKLVSNTYRDGEALWHHLIEADTMYLRTGEGTIRAIDLQTMIGKWTYRPQQAEGQLTLTVISNVAVLGTTGYAIVSDATLRAFDISNGREVGWWRSPDGVVNWRGPNGSYSSDTPVAGVASDGKRLYVSFGNKTLCVFAP